MKKNFILRPLMILAVMILPVFCFAYQEEKSGDIIAHVSPANPAPGQSVSISIESLSADLSTSNISWSINGKEVGEEIGKTSLSFTAGKAGASNIIEVTAVTRDDKSLTDTIRFITQDIDLLWQAMTYTPPFYKGKALPTSEATIKITAIPSFYVNGSLVKPQNLVYKWQKNGDALPFQSGYGKASISITGAKLFGNNVISVEVSSPDGSSSGQKSIDIPVYAPKIVFYEQTNDKGLLFNKALPSDLALTSSQLKVKAEPFFFSLNGLSSLRFQWFVNKVEANNPDNQPILSFQPVSDKAQKSVIALLITDPTSLLAQAQEALSVTTGK